MPSPVNLRAGAASPTVTVRAVMENNDRSVAEALALVRSLRAFGGRHADAPVQLHFVEELPADTAAFDALGATLTTVERFDARCPHANKLSMFYPVATDYLVAVDADILVAGDITAYLLGSGVAAVPSNGDWMPEGGWEELFAAAGLAFPADRVITPRLWQETIPYFNTGVVVVAAAQCQALRDEWAARLLQMLDAAPGRNWWGDDQRYFADQIAFAVAMCSGRFSRRVMPIEMNFSLEFDDLHPVLDPDNRLPLLMHTFHKMDFATGTVDEPPYRACREAVRAYNQLVALERAAAAPPTLRASVALDDELAR